MLLYRSLLILLFVFAFTTCEKLAVKESPLFVSLNKAKKKNLLLAEFSVKNDYGGALSAYAYRLPDKKKYFNESETEIIPHVLLIKTNHNIEQKGKFLALNKMGQTGEVISTDSTYLIYVDNQSMPQSSSIVLYEFVVEKPSEKYQLNMRDSLILEKIEIPNY